MITRCEDCYEHVPGTIRIDGQEVCQPCADRLRAIAHEKLEQELEASVEYEAMKRETIRARFVLREIVGICERPLNAHDPRLRQIKETCLEVLGNE